jgi:Uma2 family endonuclease
MVNNINDLDFSLKYSYADYLSWRFEQFVELIHGKIYPIAGPNEFHQRLITKLSFQMYSYFENKDGCMVYPAPLDVQIPDQSQKNENKDVHTVVQPDICLVCDLNKLDKRGCLGAPDLVVEILSKGSAKKDMSTKFTLYQESGDKEYWIVEPSEKNVILYHSDENKQFVAKKPFVEDQIMRSIEFPELAIDLSKVFEDLHK